MQNKVWKIAFCNLKGGVGKTTLSVQFARWLALHGKKVLLIDADCQGNASSTLIPESTGIEGQTFATLGIHCTKAAELFSDKCDSVIPYKTEAGIDIIPSEVADVDLVRCSFESMEASLNVASNVSKVENEYDYVIFDCPPSLGTAVAGPLLASDRLIVPVVLGGNFQESIRSIRAAVDAIRSSTPKLKLLGYVVNNLPRNSPLDEKLFKNVKDWLGEDVFPTCIHNRLTTLRAGQLKKPVFGFLNKKASRELTEFFDSIMDRLGESRLGLPEVTKEEK